MTPFSIEQAMQIAIGHHVAGRLAEAEAIYRQVLARSPDHAQALHLLGALACQVGQLEAAIELIGRAIAIDPLAARYHLDRGEAYRRSGRLEVAVAGFQRAIALEPGLAPGAKQPGQCALGPGPARGGAGRRAAGDRAGAGSCRGVQQPGERAEGPGLVR